MSKFLRATEWKALATQEFLSDCADDDRPEELWKLLWILRYIANGEDYPTADADMTDPITVRRLAFEIIEEMLYTGKLRAWFTNYPITDTYHLEPARGTVCQIMQRIEAEWDALGREPSMCEIVAFSASDQEAANKALNPTGNKPAS